MKTLNQIAAVALAAVVVGTTFVGCSSDNDPIKSVDPQIGLDVEAGFSRSEADALGIAQRFFNKSTSGSRSSSDLTVSYYTNPQKSRNEAADILSYIVNRGDDDGFILVASDKHVSPVLAFSETGHFSYEVSSDDPVYTYFLSNLEAYYAAAAQNDTVPDFDDDDDPWSGCVVRANAESTGWSQEYPYNKYVEDEHPGCDAGCVAVATGLIMHYSMDRLPYHGETFEFANIRKAMAGEAGASMARSQAQDKIAKLLYYIGKDVKMIYNPDPLYGSTAKTSSALALLNRLNFRIGSDVLLKYDAQKIAWALLHKEFVYMHGQDSKQERSGHDWVLDGCQVCFKPGVTEANYTVADLTNIYLKCDWGWAGQDNGYYAADAFKTSDYTFDTNLQYITVAFGNATVGEVIL